MSKQNDNAREQSLNYLDDVINLLRVRLMEAVHTEVNSCREIVAGILDGTISQVLQGEGSSITASDEDDMMEDMEDESADSSDQLGDCDQEMDVATVASEQCEEVMEERDWNEDSRVQQQPELSDVDLKDLSTPESLESIMHKIFIEAAKVVINMLENAETDESMACDD